MSSQQNNNFKAPKPPPSSSEKKKDRTRVPLGAIPENKDDPSVGDAMALDKNGYVNKNILKKNNKSLSHMSWMCPGLHEEGTRQEIARTTFNQLLTNHDRFIIPIFQRRYCWKEEQVERWYEDSRRGTRDPMGSHNTGNLVITRLSEGCNDYVLIDGQQRVTTTLIFLSALRDCLQNLLSHHHHGSLPPKLAEEKETILREISTYLYVIKDDVPQPGASESAPAGSSGFGMKLRSCYLDRESFYSILTDSSPDLESYQGKAYKVFMDCLKKEVKEKTDLWDKVEMVGETVHQCLDLMSVTMVKIVNSVDPAQVFLWLQEKSFFNGYMLQNLRPGEFFRCCDLVRNMVLAPLIKLPDTDQDKFYLEWWLGRLENRFCSNDEFNVAVVGYIEARRAGMDESSEFEVTFTKMFKQMNQGDRFLGLYQYCKFVTIYETVNKQVEDGLLGLDPVDEAAGVPSELRTSTIIVKDMEKFFVSKEKN